MQTEGFGAFYKGFLSYFLRIGPWNVFFFMAYEQYKATALPRLVTLDWDENIKMQSIKEVKDILCTCAISLFLYFTREK